LASLWSFQDLHLEKISQKHRATVVTFFRGAFVDGDGKSDRFLSLINEERGDGLSSIQGRSVRFGDFHRKIE